jgi:hypothetical protein
MVVGDKVPEISYELIPDTNYNKFNFAYTNRYKYMTVYSSEGETFFETYNIPDIPKNAKDIYHQLKSGEEGRWDLISYKYYKTVSYWWLICLANDINDPFNSPLAGSVIRIPSLSYLTIGM